MNNLIASAVEVKVDRKILFKNLNLTIYPGQITVIVGENGIGKTSLLNCFGGITRPTKGTICLGEKDLSNLPCQCRAQLVSSSGQNDHLPSDLIVSDRIFQGLSSRLGFHVLPNSIHFKQINIIAEALKISHLLERPLYSLSGGERKRVNIARGLIDSQALVFIFDEPDAGLDLRHRHALIQIFNNLKKNDKIIILSLHDLELAQKIADRVIILTAGQIAADLARDSTITLESIRQCFN